MESYWVYILTNVGKTVLYTGVANDLERRLREHRTGCGSKFASRYRTFTLIWAQEFSHVDEALEAEKRIKGWRRSKKIALIAQTNPQWRDITLLRTGGSQ